MNIKASGSSAKLEKSYFDVLGLCCSSEVPLIEKLLKPLEGVHEVSVVVPSKTVIVIHDSLLISQIQIVKTLNKVQLEANVRVKGESNFRNKWPNPFAVACGVLLLLSFLKYFYSPLKWLALGAVAVGIVPIILKSIASLRSFRLDINTLMLIAVGGSIFLKDFWEAGTIVFLFTTSEWLESRASHKATSVMSSLMNIAPQRAVLEEAGKEVDVSEVAVNTILAVKAGEVIPIDGTVVDGKSEVDEKALTGESFPVSKEVDSTVWAGTINLTGYISVKTTALAEDCVVARMAKLVEEAQNNQSKTQRYIDKCAIYYTPAIVVIAGCLAAIPAAMRVHDRNKWFHLALVVLVSACPCALVLSTPVATFCALSRAATSGLLVKGAEYLETLSGVKIIGFDKTGTITRGEFSVSNFQSLADDVSLEKLLYWVSSIECKSSHPMAAALVDYAQTRSVKPRADDVEEFENFPGEGIYGKIEGKSVYVGNRKIAIRALCSTVPNNEDGSNEGKSIGYIFLGSSLAGAFSLYDTCRTGVKEALDELKSMGIKTAMLTGDSQAAANYAKNQLGGALDVVHAELLPQDKAKIIKEFQKESPTAMVGDGINDAPALATADIGISMGVSGSALATETGNVILMSNDIRKIPKAVRLARKTRRKIFENIFLAIVTKAAIIALAIAGHPLVWAAVLADVGTCLLVIFNSMLLLRGTTAPRSVKGHSGSHHKHQHHCCSSNATSSSGFKSQAKYEPVNCSSKKCTNVEKKGCCGEERVQTCEPVNCSSKKCSSMEKDGCCGQDRVQPKCEPVNCYSKKCSSVEKTDGCCSQDNKVNELHQHKITVEEHGGCSHNDHVHEKHSAQAMTGTSNCGGHDGHIHENDSEQGTEENHGCCVHDKQVHEVMRCGGMEDGNTCCSHSDDEEDGCCAHTDDGADLGKQSLQGVENKHDCCDHSDDEIHEVKDAVKPKESDHGCCSTVVDEVHMVKHSVQVNENKQECCAHDHEHEKEENRVQGTEKQHGRCAHTHEADETKHPLQDSNCNEISKDLGSQITESKCWGNSARKEGDCSHNQTKHQQPHCHLDHHTEIHETISLLDHNCKKNDHHHHHHQHNHHRHHHHHHHHAKKYISEEQLGKVVRSCCVNHGLEKRHVGGCCKSYRKECCGSPQFGVGFTGGLSEIVIE